MSTVQLSKAAYKKSLLHSLKYSQEDVIGVLIGTLEGSQYQLSDAFPLFHTKVLQCPLEVAFQLIEANIPKGQQIIGIYESRIVKDGQQVSQLGKDILEAIQSNTKKQPIFMKVVEVELEEELPTQLIAMFYSGEQKLNLVGELEYDIISNSLKKCEHWQVVDFDGHLENVSLDFTNKYLNE